MGKYVADFAITHPAAQVFDAASKAVRSMGWRVLSEDADRMELEAKPTDDFLNHPPPEKFSSWHQTASLGTTIHVFVKAIEPGARLRLESKTRFRITVREGRTKRDVQWLYEEISNILASESSRLS